MLYCITLFLQKNFPKSFTVDEIVSAVNKEFSLWTPIRIYKKGVSKILKEVSSEISVSKNQDGETRFTLNQSNITLENRQHKFKEELLNLERLLLDYFAFQNNVFVGLSVPAILNKIANKTGLQPPRKDLYVILKGTLQEHIIYQKHNSTYHLSSSENTKRFINSIKHQLGKYWDISTQKIKKHSRDPLNNNTISISSFDLRDEWLDQLAFKENKLPSRSTNTSKVENKESSLQKEDILSTIKKYKKLNQQWADVQKDKSISLEEKRRLLLNNKDVTDEIYDEIISAFASSPNLLTELKLELGNLFMSVIDSLEEQDIDIHKEIYQEKDSTVISESYLSSSQHSILTEILPLSLFYKNIPKVSELKDVIEKYEHRIKEVAIEENLDLKTVDRSIFICKSDYAVEEDWELVYSLIYKSVKKDTLELNRKGKLLQTYMQNPFDNFINLIECRSENFEFNESPKFKAILDEVCRDNVITEREREYLFEKARYYGIPLEKLQLFLKTDYVNYPSFIPLINEICEDGIIEAHEEEYIYEKAIVYNIPIDVVDQLIRLGLFKVKLFSRLNNNQDFRNIVYIFLISSVLDIESIKLSIRNFISELPGTVHKLDQFKRELLENLTIKLESFLGIPVIGRISSLDDLLTKLKISKKKGNLIGIATKTFEWEIFVNQSRAKAEDGIEIDFINKQLIFNETRGRNRLDLLEEFVNNLFKERRYHRNQKVDLFFEKKIEFYNERK